MDYDEKNAFGLSAEFIAELANLRSADKARLDHILLEGEGTGWHEAAMAELGPDFGKPDSRERWLAVARKHIDQARGKA